MWSLLLFVVSSFLVLTLSQLCVKLMQGSNNSSTSTVELKKTPVTKGGPNPHDLSVNWSSITKRVPMISGMFPTQDELQ